MRTTDASPPESVAVIGAGFIGTHVASGLLRAGLRTAVVTRSAPDPATLALLEGAVISVFDAGARDLLRPALAGVDHIVHCASGLTPAAANRDPLADITLSLPPLINVLELVRERPDVGITYLSSGGTVYGATTADPIPEHAPTEPITAYGVSKLAGEHYVRLQHRRHGHPIRILRCANVYGPRQPATRDQGAVAVFLERIAAGRPVPLYGDGSIVRDFVHVDDVVALLLGGLAVPGGSRTLNVGSGQGHSLTEVIRLIEVLLDRPAKIEWRPDRGYDAPRIVLDISRARRELGFAPIALREGLARTARATGLIPQVR